MSLNCVLLKKTAYQLYQLYNNCQGGGPRVVVSTAAFQARVRGSVPALGGLKETKNVSPPSTCESQYCDREVACPPALEF